MAKTNKTSQSDNARMLRAGLAGAAIGAVTGAAALAATDKKTRDKIQKQVKGGVRKAKATVAKKVDEIATTAQEKASSRTSDDE